MADPDRPGWRAWLLVALVLVLVVAALAVLWAAWPTADAPGPPYALPPSGRPS